MAKTKRVTMNFGVLPEKGVFLKQFNKYLDGEWWHTFKGSDAEVGGRLGIPLEIDRNSPVDGEQLYKYLVLLVKDREEGCDESGSLAASIMTVTGFEWI